MKRLLILALGAAFAAGACGTTASDATDTSLNSGNSAAAGAAAVPAVAKAAPAGPVYREVTIPSGTTLPLALTSSMASDTSAVEDPVTAELTRAITIDGRDVLPAGARLDGLVTEVDDSGRVKGRAMIGFRFTSLRTGGEQYDVQTAALSHVAPAMKGEDATKIGVGTGAGAVIGGTSAGRTAQPKARSSAAAPAPASYWPPKARKCASRRVRMSPAS